MVMLVMGLAAVLAAALVWLIVAEPLGLNRLIRRWRRRARDGVRFRSGLGRSRKEDL